MGECACPGTGRRASGMRAGLTPHLAVYLRWVQLEPEYGWVVEQRPAAEVGVG